MLKIVHTPNKILTTPVKEVKKIGPEITRLIKNMQKTLSIQKDPEGVGLAAPQVDMDLAIFITRPMPDSNFGVFINPKIIQTKKNPTSRKKPLEGCLSIPKIWSPIKRPQKVLLQYQDLTGTLKKEWFTDFEAVIIQHEMDHLNGILFPQRALEQNTPLYEERGDKLEKVEI